MQHDDRLSRPAVAGFGVDAEERAAAGVQVHRLAVEDHVDDLRFQPALAFEILGRGEGRRKRESGEPACKERGGGDAPEGSDRPVRCCSCGQFHVTVPAGIATFCIRHVERWSHAAT